MSFRPLFLLYKKNYKLKPFDFFDYSLNFARILFNVVQIEVLH